MDGTKQGTSGRIYQFLSAARASAALSDRGIATVPLSGLGPEGQVFTVTAADFQKIVSRF